MDVGNKVSVILAGVDGNAWNLLAVWRRAARDQGWEEAAIEEVTTEAMAGDYQNLIATLGSYSDPGALLGTADEFDPCAEDTP